MPRVKRGVIAAKRRRNILKQTKGFRWGRKSKERQAKEALLHVAQHVKRSRKLKKRVNRSLWQIRINAAVRPEGLNYSKFMHGLKKSGIEINRKILSELAKSQPEVFKEIVKKAKAVM